MAKRNFSFVSVIFLISVAILIVSNSPALGEIIYLKNGSVLKGSIIKEGRTDITIKNENGEKAIKLSDIQRILYGNNEMEKIFIITNSGKTEKGYMVDQDDDKITIREDPSSPKEKIISKKEIREISRDEIYPVDLELFAKLSWFMPFDSGGADLTNSMLYTFGMGFNSMMAMNLRFVLESGFTRSKSASNSGRYLQIIPITLSLTYRFGTENFGIIPKIGAGLAIMEFNTNEEKTLKSKSLEGLAGAGIVYGISRRVDLGLWGEYAVFYDGSDYLQAGLISFSFSYRL
jgi:hypothetical protein